MSTKSTNSKITIFQTKFLEWYDFFCKIQSDQILLLYSAKSSSKLEMSLSYKHKQPNISMQLAV